MSACNAVDKAHDVEFKALESSLNMMSKGGSQNINVDNVLMGCYSSERRVGLVSLDVNR